MTHAQAILLVLEEFAKRVRVEWKYMKKGSSEQRQIILEKKEKEVLKAELRAAARQGGFTLTYDWWRG